MNVLSIIFISIDIIYTRETGEGWTMNDKKNEVNILKVGGEVFTIKVRRVNKKVAYKIFLSVKI